VRTRSTQSLYCYNDNIIKTSRNRLMLKIDAIKKYACE